MCLNRSPEPHPNNLIYDNVLAFIVIIIDTSTTAPTHPPTTANNNSYLLLTNYFLMHTMDGRSLHHLMYACL